MKRIVCKLALYAASFLQCGVTGASSWPAFNDDESPAFQPEA